MPRHNLILIRAVVTLVVVVLLHFPAGCSKKEKESEISPPVATSAPAVEVQAQATPPATLSPAPPTHSPEQHGKVIQVIQADTLKILEQKKKELVRLYGVHLPKGKSAILARGKKLAEKLVLGKSVRLEVKGKDGAGHILAIVILPPGTNLNHELVRDGDVIWDPKSGKDPVAQELQDQAKTAKKGLWASSAKKRK